ncbi:DUF262 domain-containing protein [Cognataquiflexum aquatile]|uniref:DUF262 domain-containing protein n=1 Tax=Cognataquiflexum aquatile TaxID=2249427 RepID=UPI000DEB9FE0|nr:DUF262 domain-containing protein [Cognataquiflexum aquatile]
MNITPNKLTIAQLFATPNEQFIVPSYQRRYAWGYNQYTALYEDLDMLKDGDGHLFGTIILHTLLHTGGINKPELVDGQQRMTTLVILLKAFENVYRLKEKSQKADEIKKMCICRGLDEVERPKLILGDLDNKDISNLILANQIDTASNKKIIAAYESYFRWLSDLELDQLNRFFYKLTNVAVVIRLDVGMAQDAYKLFETINNRGLKLSPTDIIKNFLLGHAAKINQDQTLEKVKELWSNIIMDLDEIDTDDFLRQLICSLLHRKVTMTMLVPEFKKFYLKNIEKAELLGEFDYFSDDSGIEDDLDEVELNERESTEEDSNIRTRISIIELLQIIRTLALSYRKITFEEFPRVKLNRRIGNLNKILSKPTYIFLMHFLKNDDYTEKTKLEVLKFLETLMLRRHICERRTSENDDIFSKLVPLIGDENILDKVKSHIIEQEYMPSDSEFEESFSKHQFKGKLTDRAKYVLETIEYFKRGNTEELVVASAHEVHLEHIIPQTIDTKKSKEEFGDWVTYLGDKSVIKHKKYVNYIGNMTLLGEALNIQAYNNPFAKKKASYKKSNLLITSELGNQSDFKFTHIDKRGQQLTEIALKIWTT